VLVNNNNYERTAGLQVCLPTAQGPERNTQSIEGGCRGEGGESQASNGDHVAAQQSGVPHNLIPLFGGRD